jgi:hypothetical protein
VAGANPGIRKYGRMADLRRPEIRLNRVRADQGVGFGPEGWPVNRRLSGRWLEPNARHTSQKPLTSKHAVRGLSRLCGCVRWVGRAQVAVPMRTQVWGAAWVRQGKGNTAMGDIEWCFRS